MNGRCSQLLLRATIVCFIMFVVIGYSFALSRNFNLMRNLQNSDVLFVTNLLQPGKLHQNLIFVNTAISRINRPLAPVLSSLGTFQTSILLCKTVTTPLMPDMD